MMAETGLRFHSDEYIQMSIDANTHYTGVANVGKKTSITLSFSFFQLVLLAVLGSTGCDFVYFHYTDCRYYDGPRFDRTVLNQPVLNNAYIDIIHIEFDDDRHIDSYDYWLQFAGTLPPGITYYQNNRNIHFEGAATSPGTYSFVITAGVRYRIYDRYYYGSSSEYCTYRTTQNFQLVVRTT